MTSLLECLVEGFMKAILTLIVLYRVLILVVFAWITIAILLFKELS